MQRSTRLALAAGLAALPAGAAWAVDLPPAPELPAAGPAHDFSGFYLRGDVGVGFEPAPTLRVEPSPIASGLLSPYATQSFGNTSLSPSAMADVGVGYQPNDWLRFDATLEYRGGARLKSAYALNDPAWPAFGGPLHYAASVRGNVAALVGLLNGYVDLPGLWGLTPFVGAGVGFAVNALSGFSTDGVAYDAQGAVGASGGAFASGSQTNFARALMAGLDYEIAPGVALELSYRRLDLGKVATGGFSCFLVGALGAALCSAGEPVLASRHALASNDLRLGLIWTLGEDAAPPPILARD